MSCLPRANISQTALQLYVSLHTFPDHGPPCVLLSHTGGSESVAPRPAATSHESFTPDLPGQKHCVCGRSMRFELITFWMMLRFQNHCPEQSPPRSPCPHCWCHSLSTANRHPLRGGLCSDEKQPNGWVCSKMHWVNSTELTGKETKWEDLCKYSCVKISSKVNKTFHG